MENDILQLDPDTAGEYYIQLLQLKQQIIKYGQQDKFTWEDHVDVTVQLGILLGKLELCQISVKEFAIIQALINIG